MRLIHANVSVGAYMFILRRHNDEILTLRLRMLKKSHFEKSSVSI